MAADLFTARPPSQYQSALFHAPAQQLQQQPQQPQQQLQQLQQQPQLPAFAASQQYQTCTPQISPLSTSGNASPTSPKPYMTRPIRPLYMPAVLRPTEFPSRVLPKSQYDDNEDDDDQMLKSNSSFISLGGLGALSRLSRRSTGDSGKCVDEDWVSDAFPKPTGAPKRDHWKPDHESSVCDHATCRRTFTYFTRRHHCRRCGNIFCDVHSSYEIPLDQDANYNPRGLQSRACAHCFSHFKEWRSRTNSQSSTASSDTDGSDKPSTPVAAGSPTTPTGKPLPQATEVAMSVPRDWNWSTF